MHLLLPWRTYEISTVVDAFLALLHEFPWRTYEISTVVDVIVVSASLDSLENL